MTTSDSSRSEEQVAPGRGWTPDYSEQHPEAAFITTQIQCAACSASLLGLSTLGMCPSCGTTVRATLLAIERREEEATNTSNDRSDVLCARCGYDLQGLADDGACPECGLAVAVSQKGAMLSAASPQYLKTVHTGLVIVLTSVFVMLFSSILTIVFFFFGAAAGSSVLLALGIVMLILIPASAIGWMCGWWMFSTKDPQFVEVRERSVARKRSRFYLVAYLTLIALSLMLVFLAPGLQPGRNPVLGIMISLGALCYLASFIALVLQYVFSMLYVRWMALRIPNESLANWAKTLTWLGPIIYILASFVVIGPILALGIYWSLLDNMRREIKAVRRFNELEAEMFGPGV